MRVMFRITHDKDRQDVWEDVAQRINSISTALFVHFLDGVGPETREIWSPLIMLVIREWLALDDEQVRG